MTWEYLVYKETEQPHDEKELIKWSYPAPSWSHPGLLGISQLFVTRLFLSNCSKEVIQFQFSAVWSTGYPYNSPNEDEQKC